MTINQLLLIRASGFAAIAGGALRVASTFIPYAPQSPGLEFMYGVEDGLMLFGLMGIYLPIAPETGRAGLAGFVVSAASLASIVGPDAVMFGIDFYTVGAAALLIGLSVLSAALLGAQQQRPAAALWLVAFALALAGTALKQPLLVAASGLVFGAGFVAAGWAVNNSSASPARARR